MIVSANTTIQNVCKKVSFLLLTFASLTFFVFCWMVYRAAGDSPWLARMFNGQFGNYSPDDLSAMQVILLNCTGFFQAISFLAAMAALGMYFNTVSTDGFMAAGTIRWMRFAGYALLATSLALTLSEPANALIATLGPSQMTRPLPLYIEAQNLLGLLMSLAFIALGKIMEAKSRE